MYLSLYLNTKTKKRTGNVYRQKMKTINNFRGNVKKSLNSLVLTGIAYTGHSGYSKGWASKSVWTADVVAACKELGIEVESGNDAPKGGANGEFVRLVSDKRKNRKIWADMTAAKLAKEAAEKQQAQYKAKFIAFVQENVEQIKANKIPGESWATTIARALHAAGFNDFPMGFNQIKSIMFSGMPAKEFFNN
jgi:hypothetical protein